jgi:hypothetical protein
LDEAQERQDDCAPDADAFIGRHQRHQERPDAHEHEGCNERGFASDAVAIVAEYRSTHRPGNEAHGIDSESLEGADERLRSREEPLFFCTRRRNELIAKGAITKANSGL